MERNTNPQKRYAEQLKLKAVQMHMESGYTLECISKIFGSSKSTIWRWINNFAEENAKEKKSMNESHPQSDAPNDTLAVVSLSKKEDNELSSDTDTISMVVAQSSAEEELVRLRQLLQKEKLRADAYEEMIDVAESRFNIAIRKKAGAKQ